MGVCGHLIHLLSNCCQPDSFGKRKRVPVSPFLSSVWRLRSGLGCSPAAGETTWLGLARSQDAVTRCLQPIHSAPLGAEPVWRTVLVNRCPHPVRIFGVSPWLRAGARKDFWGRTWGVCLNESEEWFSSLHSALCGPGRKGPLHFLGMCWAGLPQLLFVPRGISQGSENNTSLGRNMRGGCHIRFEFFEISKHLRKLIMVGRCEKLFKTGTFSPKA